MASLDRFKTAQASADAGFETARRELAAGGKRSHWIWYVFPQLAGLGQSAAATHYGLAGASEATAYLRDPLLRARLLDVATVVAAQLRREPAPALTDLMGSSIDAVKLVSSMTLFREIARRLVEAGETAREKTGETAEEAHAEYRALAEQADAILAAASRQGFAPCRWTLDQLADAAR